MDIELLTTEDVARIFHCDCTTVTRWVRRMGLPCLKPGRRMLFRKDIVLDWIGNQETKSEKKYQPNI
jgi:excisionase family DNA binding protein